MKIHFTYFLVLLCYSCSEGSARHYAGYKAYSVKGDSHNLSQLKKSFEESQDALFLEGNKKHLQFLVAPDYDSNFQSKVNEKGLSATVEHEDISHIIGKEKIKSKSSAFSWDAYYNVDDIYTYLRKVAEKNDTLASTVTAGTSYESRPLLGLKISTPDDNENATKPKIFIESGIHAREWITPAVSTFFINELLTSTDPDVITLRDTFEWQIFPTVNPDGYHYSHTEDRYWRKSRSRSANSSCYGVDLNRNWDHNWGESGISTEPCHYALYAGSQAFSENETRAISQYVSGLDNLLGYIGLHACAQMLLIPYSDSTDHYEKYNDLVRIGNSSLIYGERVNGEQYYGPGTAAEILYGASGGSMDWVKETLGTPLVFTYELRGDYFYWPPERIPEQGNELTQMMIGLFKEAKELGYY